MLLAKWKHSIVNFPLLQNILLFVQSSSIMKTKAPPNGQAFLSSSVWIHFSPTTVISDPTSERCLGKQPAHFIPLLLPLSATTYFTSRLALQNKPFCGLVEVGREQILVVNALEYHLFKLLPWNMSNHILSHTFHNMHSHSPLAHNFKKSTKENHFLRKHPKS